VLRRGLWCTKRGDKKSPLRPLPPALPLTTWSHLHLPTTNAMLHQPATNNSQLADDGWLLLSYSVI
jgi:hypothetical protein